jgi:hypothetical protein
MENGCSVRNLRLIINLNLKLMSYITDFKSSAFALFKQATSVSTGTGAVQPDAVTYVGQKFTLNDGREVAIIGNGAVALTSGVLVQGEALVANHQNLAVAVPATTPATAGTFAISVTLGATLLKTNYYMGGYAIVNAGTGIGQTLRIASHSNAVASAAGVIITLEDALVVTLDATSKVSLYPNPYRAVVINPTTATNTPVGVTLYPVAAAVAPTTDGTTGAQTAAGTQQYAFVQTKGVVSVLSDATVAGIGLGVMPSTSTAGCVTVQAATGANIGRAMILGVSAESRAVFLDL